MKVLFVASEAAPFIKTGGLADVAGSLPKALKSIGVDARVVIPNYSLIKEKYKEEMELIDTTEVNLSWRKQYVGIKHHNLDDVDYYFLDNEYYFKRDSLYGHYDDGERFSYFSKAVLSMIKTLDFKPDVIHFNDWHTGVLGLLLDDLKEKDDFYKGIKTLYTIHNLKYQGVFPKHILTDLLGLDMGYFTSESVEYHGNMNFMKAGIAYADRVSTVSESYADEIKYPYFGEGLDGLLRKRENSLSGIVNGIDYGVYDPANDANIFKNFNKENVAEVKKENKKALQELMGLDIDPEKPIVAMVTRLADMKGLDLLEFIFAELMEEDLQFVILGTGETHYENHLKHLDYIYHNKFRANIFFDQELSHKIYAASDIFVMPSLYEPCGLGQLIALRYGTIPVVRQIGGLKDTVVPFNKFTLEGTGFGFLNYNAHELLFTIKEALSIYEDKSMWNQLVQQAMSADHSWNHSAELYLELYNSL